MQLFSSSHLMRWIYSCQAIISGTLIEVVQVFSSSHILSLIHGFQAFISDTFTEMEHLISGYPFCKWIHGFPAIISGIFTVMPLCRWIHGFQATISGTFAEMMQLFQACVSGDGYMVFKPSSLTPFQRWCSCFLSIISCDSCFPRVSSLEVFIWLSCNYLLHIYRDYAAVFRVSSMKMGISMVFKPSSLAPLWQNLWLN